LTRGERSQVLLGHMLFLQNKYKKQQILNIEKLHGSLSEVV